MIYKCKINKNNQKRKRTTFSIVNDFYTKLIDLNVLYTKKKGRIYYNYNRFSHIMRNYRIKRQKKIDWKSIFKSKQIIVLLFNIIQFITNKKVVKIEIQKNFSSYLIDKFIIKILFVKNGKKFARNFANFLKD